MSTAIALPPSSRRRRRLGVVAVLAVTAMLGSQLPSTLYGFGIVVVLILAGLDVLLIQATGALAFRRSAALDERETSLRDRAYRRGFRLLGLAVALELVVFIVSAYITTAIANATQSGFTFNELATVISGRGVTVIVELLLMLPTLVIAWSGEDGSPAEPAQPTRRLRWLWLSLPALLVAWILAVGLLPEQAVANSGNTSSGGIQGATCQQFSAGRAVGTQFGAVVGLRAEVCWNGHDAFVSGDPSIPLPASAIAAMQLPPGIPASDFNSSQGNFSKCGADNSADFAVVTSMTCTGSIDARGTLHYTVRADVGLLPGVGQRSVTLLLVVDRNGRVLQAP